MSWALRGAVYLIATLIGVLALVYPFLLPYRAEGADGFAHLTDAPLLTAGLAGLAMVALLLELQGRSMRATTVAALGVLVAVTAVLRFLALAVPGLAGASPVFLPIMLAGYVFGVRFGFLMGALSLLVSALITGGVGPWLPFQMFAAGWMGGSAGMLRPIALRLPPRLALGALAAFGFLWGLLFGAVMDLYFWPFAAGPAEQFWAPGVGVGETIGRFALFYVATSLWWDLVRSVGNVVLIVVLGPALIKALARFRGRFDFQYAAS